MSTVQICSKLKPLLRSSSFASVLQRPIAATSPNCIISRREQPGRCSGGGCNGNNITLRTFSSLFSSNLSDSLFHNNQLQLQHRSLTTICTRSGFEPAGNASTAIAGSHISARTMASLNQMHRTGPFIKKRKRPRPTDGRPQMKGVVIKTFVKKPKKPNSANRKCVRVRLSNGREAIAYVPREGHTLQEHSVVLVRPGNVQDLPGVSLKCVRGKYDLGHVIKK